MKAIAVVRLGGHYAVVAKTTYPRESKAPDRKSRLATMYCGIDKSAAEFVANNLKNTKVQVFMVRDNYGVTHVVKRYTDSHFAYNRIKKNGKYKYVSFQRVRKGEVQKYIDKAEI